MGLKTQNISGKVKVQGKTLVFKDFSYDGSTPDVYIYVGFDGCPMVSGGTPLAKLQQRKHEKEYFGLSLSTVQMQVTWVSVWDVKKDEELANAFFCPEDGDKCRGTSSVPQ